MNMNINNTKRTDKRAKKEAIIESAFKLFYTHGVDGTSFEAIAGDCGVTAPLITYHFKTKNRLVEEIATQLTSRIAASVLEKFYVNGIKYDPKTALAVNIMVLHHLLADDHKACQFFLYFLNCGFENNFIHGHKEYYASLDRYFCLGLDQSKDEISLLSTSLLFSAFSLTYAFFTGRVNCSLEELTDYMIRVQFKLMDIPVNEISSILDQSKQLYEKLQFRFEHYFQIR